MTDMDDVLSYIKENKRMSFSRREVIHMLNTDTNITTNEPLTTNERYLLKDFVEKTFEEHLNKKEGMELCEKLINSLEKKLEGFKKIHNVLKNSRRLIQHEDVDPGLWEIENVYPHFDTSEGTQILQEFVFGGCFEQEL